MEGKQLMATMHFHQTTTATPEEFVSGLTDFGPGRSKIFAFSDDSYLRVHASGPHWADVTEGSGGSWERLDYDWSDPHHVVLITKDSNLYGGASGYTYTLTQRPDGATDIDAVIVREGKNLAGNLRCALLGTLGRPVLKNAFVKSVKAIEARSSAAQRS
jgi:hypothetical protein